MTVSLLCTGLLFLGVLCSYFDDPSVSARRRIRGWKRERLVVTSGNRRRAS